LAQAAAVQLLGGKYELTQLLGEGAMGAVYRARHRGLGTSVAIKLLHPELATRPDLVARFRQEAHAASAIGHPHIVAVHDLATAENGACYLVMELLRGESLRQLLEREGRLSMEQTVALVGQLLSALAAAHHAGVVHRDLKPDNLFVVDTGDGEPFLKVLDFGISKIRAGEPLGEGGAATVAGALLGSPHYMAPEQARGDLDIDGRVDLWATGCILFECLAGEPPFVAASTAEVLAEILRGSAPSLQARCPGVSPELAAVVRRALQREREARYGDARAMRAELLACVGRSVTGIHGTAPLDLPLGGDAPVLMTLDGGAHPAAGAATVKPPPAEGGPTEPGGTARSADGRFAPHPAADAPLELAVELAELRGQPKGGEAGGAGWRRWGHLRRWLGLAVGLSLVGAAVAWLLLERPELGDWAGELRGAHPVRWAVELYRSLAD
jgi:serine/threonine-protein kinase